jgi:2',3'-cyclic-nucleotide 2'-phosphodiesterase (5'-nucleotidase family)
MKTSLLHYIHILLVCAILSACSSTPKIQKVETSHVVLNASTVDTYDSTFIKTVMPYKSKMDSIMNEVLGISDQALLKGLPEGTLGDFASDAVLKKTNDVYNPSDNHLADICLLNNGGLRSQLPKGKITLGNVFELMPFENEIVILTLSGEKTKQLFESLVENNGAPFSGATVKGKGKKMTELKIGGKEFDITKTYKVATSDYLAGGGDKYSFFSSPIKVDTLKYKLRDAIVDYIKDETKKGNTIKVALDGRIKYE